MTASYAHAASLVGAGRYEEAKPLLVEICGAAPAALDPWVMLGLCLVAHTDVAAFLRLVELRQRQAGDGLALFNDCLLLALAWPDRRPLGRVIASVPADSALTIIARYVGALMTATAGDADRAIAQVQDAAALAAALPPQLAAMPCVATIIGEAALLARFDAVAAIERRDHRDLLAALGMVQAGADFAALTPPSAASEFVFMSSCDERYLDRFGAGVVRALDMAGVRTVYHLHIVDPSSALGDKIAHLQSLCHMLTLDYSTETYRCDQMGYERASYYALSRLVRLPEIFNRYGRDVFMWDVDVEAVRNLDALSAAMRGYDLGYFEMRNTRLTLVCHLAVAYFANTPATRRLAELIRNFILTKLPHTPYWLFDQTAVYCASRYLAARADLRIRDFTMTGGGLADHVDAASSAGHKQSMRKRAGLADVATATPPVAEGGRTRPPGAKTTPHLTALAPD